MKHFSINQKFYSGAIFIDTGNISNAIGLHIAERSEYNNFGSKNIYHQINIKLKVLLTSTETLFGLAEVNVSELFLSSIRGSAKAGGLAEAHFAPRRLGFRVSNRRRALGSKRDDKSEGPFHP